VAIAKSSQTSSGAFEQLFKFTYADVIVKLLDSVDDLEKWIDSVALENWNGGDSLYQLYKTAEGSGSRFVSGGPGASAPVLPKYNPPSYSESTVRLYPHMDIVEITGPKLVRAHDKPGMYRQIMDELVSDAKQSHRNRVGPKYWWGTSGAADSNAGTLALVNGATTASTTVVLKQRECDASLFSGTKAYMSTYAGARYIRPGMQLAIGTAATLADNSAPTTTVVSVNQTTQTVTLAEPLTLADNNYVVEGDENGNEYGNVLTGLHDAINDTGTYHGINKATNAPWQSWLTMGMSCVISTTSGSRACSCEWVISDRRTSRR
jgi:subtilisin family serine protease